MAWPVTPSIPGVVHTGDLITAGWNNQHRQATADIWTNVQFISASSLGAVPTSRQVIAGAGMSGGGDLSADRTLTANVQTVFGRAGAVVLTGPDITGAGGVLNTRQVIAGAGLTGGGALSADVTLTLALTPALIAAASGVVTTGSYANPAWITSLASSKLTGAPPAAVIAASQTPWLQAIDAGGFYLTHVPSILISATQNVAPGYMLDVRSGSSNNTAIHVAYDTSDTGGYISVGAGGGLNMSSGIALVNGNWTAKAANWGLFQIAANVFQVWLGTGATVGNTVTLPAAAFTVSGTNVGINNSAPTGLLDVNAPSGQSFPLINRSAATNATQKFTLNANRNEIAFFYDAAAAIGCSVGMTSQTQTQGAQQGNFVVATYVSGSGSIDRLTIVNATGNVGIGNAGAALFAGAFVHLIVGGSAAGSGGAITVAAAQSSAGGQVGSLNFANLVLAGPDYRVASIGALTGAATNSGQLIFYVWNAGTAVNQMSISPTGVLVANAAADSTGCKLQVTGGISNNNAVVSAPSDIRLKRDVEPYRAGLAAVLNVNPIRFAYNGKGGMNEGARWVSIDAGAHRDVIPDAIVRYQGELDGVPTELYNFSLQPLVMALVNATKELAARVAQLEQGRSFA